MKPLIGRIPVLAGACLLALAGAAQAAPAAPRLVATAAFPGVVEAQTATFDLGPLLRQPDLRLDDQPTADTAVVTGFDTRYVRRGGRLVPLRGRACVRLRLRLTLHPGTADPLAVARLLLPRADVTSYVADTGSLAPLGSGAPETVEIHRYEVVKHARAGAVTSGLMLTDWRHAGSAGFVALTAQATLLRAAGGCATRFAIEQSPELITLSLLDD